MLVVCLQITAGGASRNRFFNHNYRFGSFPQSFFQSQLSLRELPIMTFLLVPVVSGASRIDNISQFDQFGSFP
jgi:hypothetical protein